MLVAALIILNKELLTGMSLGDTANLGIVSLVFAFLATVAYAVAAAFIIKSALSTASRTAPVKEQAKSQTESKDEKKVAETENAATPWHSGNGYPITSELKLSESLLYPFFCPKEKN